MNARWFWGSASLLIGVAGCSDGFEITPSERSQGSQQTGDVTSTDVLTNVDAAKAPSCEPDPVNATCADCSKNGLETDVDCGGDSCLPCGPGRTCGLDYDCMSSVCEAGTCAFVTSGRGCLGDDDCASGACAKGDCWSGLCCE
jgi:hypothetical protein